jgi:hypothetical protein
MPSKFSRVKTVRWNIVPFFSDRHCDLCGCEETKGFVAFKNSIPDHIV